MKSWFLYPAALVGGLALLASLVAAVLDGEERLAWLGASLANLPLPVFVLLLLRLRVPRTSENLPLLLLLSLAGLLIAAWESFVDQNAGWTPTAIAAVGSTLLLMYVFWYSRLQRFPNARLAVGNKLPEFEVTTLDGRIVSSAEYLGRPAVLVFYRGDWCPVCHGQVLEIAARQQELENLGVSLSLISPQSAEQSRILAERSGAASAFLVDSDNAAARALDIVDEEGVPLGRSRGYRRDSVMPTVILTNQKGTILFSDQTNNYRVRPEPDIYISILKRTGAVAT
ncbi:MAG TPA: peroxiredoxin family protein [Woeseiaceae bacterium]